MKVNLCVLEMETKYISPLRNEETSLNSNHCAYYGRRYKRKSSGNQLIHISKKANKNYKRRNNYTKLANGSQMKAIFPILILSLFIIYISFLDVTDGSPKHYCLRHCHMCKDMYGRHFMVHLCKDDCMESRGRFIPDCLDLNSIRDYLILTDWQLLKLRDNNPFHN